MTLEKTSCVHRGNTFFGDYELSGQGPDTTVRVRYKGEKLESKVGQQLTELVAHNLLRELVVREAIALKVSEAQNALGRDRPSHWFA